MNRNYLLSEEKVSKALLKLSTPSAISTILGILYSIIDTIFIGRYTSVSGLSALSIYVPIQMIISATTLLFSTGIGTNLSITLGKNQKDKAEKNVGTLVSYTLVVSLIFFLIGMFFSKDIVILFGATKSILHSSNIYAKAMFIGILFYPLTISLNSALRAEGSAKYSMNGAFIGVFSNIFLDFLFIVVFKFGILGAGLATSLSKFLNLLYIIYIYKHKSYLKIKVKNLNFDLSIVKKSIPLGLSSFSSQVAGSLAMTIFNHELLYFGSTTAIAVYGIVSRVTSSVQEAITGFTRGAAPLLSYSYGAKNRERLKGTLKYAFIYSIGFGSISSFIILIFSRDIIGLFSKNEAVINLGYKLLDLVIITTPLIGIYYLSMVFFRSIRQPKVALFLSVCRRIIYFIPFIYIFPYLLNMKLLGLFIILPLSNILCILTGIILFYRKLKDTSKTF